VVGCIREKKFVVVWYELHARFEETGILDMWLGRGREYSGNLKVTV
jgi:hypothetical protein